MASLVFPRSQLLRPIAVLLLVATIATTFTSVADSAPASYAAPAPAAATKPIKIEVYPGCSKTLMPKRCSFRLSNLTKCLDENKALIAGPTLSSNNKLKTDSCITECAKTVSDASAKAAAAKKDEEALLALKAYLYETAINNYGPIGPCECNCPEPCTKEEAAAVTRLGAATASMRDLGNQLESLLGGGEEKAAERESAGAKKAAAEMERSIDSGILHASCGLTREPQRCADELSATRETTKHAVGEAELLARQRPPPALESAINECSAAVEKANLELYSAEGQVQDLAKIRDILRSFVDKKPVPVCKYECPPEKPCTENDKAMVDQLGVVYDAWVAADKFLTELLPPSAEAKKKGTYEAPKKKA